MRSGHLQAAGGDLRQERGSGDAGEIRIDVVDHRREREAQLNGSEVDDIAGRSVVFEDDPGKNPGLSLSHEFGHNLGLEHREKSKRLVMWPFTGQHAGRLERDQILIVNTNLGK